MVESGLTIHSSRRRFAGGLIQALGDLMLDADKKSAKRRAKVQTQTVEQILRAWDPINVSPGGDEWPLGEYDGYAPHIVSMALAGCTEQALAEHLRHLQVDVMGLSPASPEATLKVARDILAALGKAGDSPEATA